MTQDVGAGIFKSYNAPERADCFTLREVYVRSLPTMIWKAIPGFPDYEVSEHGDVRRGMKLLRPDRIQGNGRKRVALSKSGIPHRMKVAHAVALAFLGPQPFEGAEVCHNDGFEHNNHYSNLRWDTHANNCRDILKHKIGKAKAGNLYVPERLRLMAEANELMAKAK